MNYCDTVTSFSPKTDLKWMIAGVWNMPEFSDPNLREIPISPKVRALSEFVAVNNFRQVNNILDHNDRTLDLVFTNCDDMDCKYCDSPLVPEDGHYPALLLNIKTRTQPNSVPKKYPKYCFRRADLSALYTSFSEISWVSVTERCEVNVSVCRSQAIVESIIKSTCHFPDLKAGNIPFGLLEELLKSLN